MRNNFHWYCFVLLLVLVNNLKGEQVTFGPINARQSTIGDIYLTDLLRHCDKGAPGLDLVNYAHETTHEVNAKVHDAAHLLSRGQGLYCYSNIAFIVREKGHTMSQFANWIPERYRSGGAYKDYLIDAVRDYPPYEQRPLYILDEWAAYMNGSQCGQEYPLLKSQTDFSFNRCCQVGIFTIIYNNNVGDKDVKLFIDYQTRRMEQFVKTFKVTGDTQNWYGNYLMMLKGRSNVKEKQSDGLIKPLE